MASGCFDRRGGTNVTRTHHSVALYAYYLSSKTGNGIDAVLQGSVYITVRVGIGDA